MNWTGIKKNSYHWNAIRVENELPWKVIWDNKYEIEEGKEIFSSSWRYKSQVLFVAQHTRWCIINLPAESRINLTWRFNQATQDHRSFCFIRLTLSQTERPTAIYFTPVPADFHLLLFSRLIRLQESWNQEWSLWNGSLFWGNVKNFATLQLWEGGWVLLITGCKSMMMILDASYIHLSVCIRPSKLRTDVWFPSEAHCNNQNISTLV